MFWTGVIAGFFIGGFFGVITICLLAMARGQTEAVGDYASHARCDMKEVKPFAER